MAEPQIDVPANRVNGRMWQPGESGNPNGRPIGARGRFSQRFVADLTDAWEKHGAAALEQTAKLYPDRFVGICSHLIPKDVSVSLTAALPGNLEASDWTLILEVLGVRNAVFTVKPDRHRMGSRLRALSGSSGSLAMWSATSPAKPIICALSFSFDFDLPRDLNVPRPRRSAFV
jgi:hypothetical protein